MKHRSFFLALALWGLGNLVANVFAGSIGSWANRTSGVSADLWGVIYANNQFVTVGDSGTILTSADGIKWTRRSSGTTARLLAVAYGKGTVVAVGREGLILTSADGITWTLRASGTTNSLNGITWGNNEFAVVGSGGTILTSPDGVSWTHCDSGVTNNLNGISYGINQFVAVGEGYTMLTLTSINGTTWTAPNGYTSLEITYWVGGVTYGNGQFVAVGGSATWAYRTYMDIWTSPDGVTWSERAGTKGYDLCGVAYGNNEFVAVGNMIYVSADGIGWYISYLTGKTFYGVAFGTNAFVAVGAGGTILQSVPPPPTITITPSGQIASPGSTVTFMLVVTGATPPLSYQWLFNDVPIPGQTNTSLTLVNVRTNQAGQYSAILSDRAGTVTSDPATLSIKSSVDPRDNWTPRASGTTNWLYGITYANNEFVIVGDEGAIITSPDGVNWTKRTSGVTYGLQAITYANNEFVVVGAGILTSPDGINWTNRPSGRVSDGWGDPSYLWGLAFGDKGFVAVGYAFHPDIMFGITYPIILTSPEGFNWTPQSTPAGGISLQCIAYGNNRFVVCSSSPLLTSIDGINWTTTNAPVSNLSCITYGNSEFVAGSSYGEIVTSPDGLAWTRRNSGTTKAVRGITYAHREFVAVGDVILTSPDAINWMSRESGVNGGLRSVAFGNNTFVAVGNNGAILQSAPLASAIAPSVLAGHLTNGSFGLSITGTMGQTYDIQSANNLSASSPWQTVVSVTLSNSQTTWRDAATTNSPQRFYRAIQR